MPCFSPLSAYYSKEFERSGKRGITFDRNASFSGVPIKVPCGQCSGCRLDKARQWAVRCVHEAKLYDENSFITLTYDPANIPDKGDLVKRDLQLFMKRLRKKKGAGIRFYGCGEYGERSFRPHYHALLFNCGFSDKRFFKMSKTGERLYHSEELFDLWPMGMNTIGEVTFDSAAYCAGYVMKKRTGDDAGWYYCNFDYETGEVYMMQPEFSNMSRRPGIGRGFYEKFSKEIYDNDSVIMNGGEIRPPRYYDTLYEIVDSEALAALKVTRRRKAMRRLKDNTPDRRRVREVVALKRQKLFNREI